MAIWNIRPVQAQDIVAITRIYNYYSLHTVISFDTEAQTEAQKFAQMQEIVAHGEYVVALCDDEVVGYAYAKPWIARPAYAHSFESTIYLDANRDVKRLHGLGSALYQALIARLAARGDVHVLIANLTLGNRASEALHEKLGFRKIAEFPEVGFKFGRWLGIQYYAYYFPSSDDGCAGKRS